MAGITPYQMKEVLHCVEREKPAIAMALVQGIALAIHQPQPTTWPEVLRLLRSNKLRHQMAEVDPVTIEGTELATLTRLIRKTKGMDLQGLRCMNLCLKWLDGVEGAARYYFEHSQKIRSENAVRRN